MSNAKSYSRWATYHKCPAKYNFLYNLKFKPERGEASPAMLRGTEIHNSCENYMNRLTEFLHPDIHAKYGQFFHGIRENYDVSPEHEFAFTEEWEPTTFSGSDCYVRGYLDCKIKTPTDQPLLIHEYKSGKIYDDHEYQRSLYGLIGLLLEPEYDSCEVQTIYLDKQEFRSVTFGRQMLDTYKWTWAERFKEMEDDGTYITKPQFGCRWCECSKEKGGPCPF